MSEFEIWQSNVRLLAIKWLTHVIICQFFALNLRKFHKFVKFWMILHAFRKSTLVVAYVYSVNLYQDLELRKCNHFMFLQVLLVSCFLFLVSLLLWSPPTPPPPPPDHSTARLLSSQSGLDFSVTGFSFETWKSLEICQPCNLKALLHSGENISLIVPFLDKFIGFQSDQNVYSTFLPQNNPN